MADRAIMMGSPDNQARSPGPVLFRQKRIRSTIKLIEVLKFRTMYQDMSDKHADRLSSATTAHYPVGAFPAASAWDETPAVPETLLVET